MVSAYGKPEDSMEGMAAFRRDNARLCSAEARRCRCRQTWVFSIDGACSARKVVHFLAVIKTNEIKKRKT